MARQTLTISTTAPTSAALVPSSLRGLPGYAAGGTALACVALCFVPARRRRLLTMLGMLVLLVTLSSAMLGCGSGTTTTGRSNGNPGTTAGAYTITVTGTSGSTTATAPLTLTVQ